MPVLKGCAANGCPPLSHVAAGGYQVVAIVKSASPLHSRRKKQAGGEGGPGGVAGSIAASATQWLSEVNPSGVAEDLVFGKN